jgi:hypothetical protein
MNDLHFERVMSAIVGRLTNNIERRNEIRLSDFLTF